MHGLSWVGIEPANFNLTAEGRKSPISGDGTFSAPPRQHYLKLILYTTSCQFF